MLQLIVRGIIYTLLAATCLFSAALFFGVGGVLGGALGAGLSIVPRLVLKMPASDADSLFSLFTYGGALLGGGCALMFLSRVWVEQLQQSDDETLYNLGNYFDELRRAVRYKP